MYSLNSNIRVCNRLLIVQLGQYSIFLHQTSRKKLLQKSNIQIIHSNFNKNAIFSTLIPASHSKKNNAKYIIYKIILQFIKKKSNLRKIKNKNML